MAVFNWSALTNGQSIVFNPAVDVLNVDVATISAASLTIASTTSAPFTSTLTSGGKQITLQADFKSLTTTNLIFADGSFLLIGDNTTGIANDDSANTLTGGAGDDRFYGLGGADQMSGGAGADTFSNVFNTASFGNDTIDGGADSDTLSYSSASANATTVNLALHTAVSSQGSLTVLSIETVLGTAGNDSFTGGDPAHQTNAIGDRTGERFRGNAGNDTITGGAGPDFSATADYANNTNAQPINVNLATGVANDGLGGTDTLVNVDQVRGGSGNDILTGGSLSRTASGTFFEIFRGNAGNDTINGNNANTDGQDASSDRADYANSTQSVIANLATGTVIDGLGGTDTLIDVEQVYSGEGNDTLTGGPNDDVFDGGFGSDVIDGAAGIDSARFDQSFAAVIVNLSAAPITVNGVTVAAGKANDGMGGTDTLINIEDARGSSFNDYIRGSDNASVRQVLSGDAGNDTIDGGAGIDLAGYGNTPLFLGGLNAFLQNGSGTVNDLVGGTDTLINIEGITGTHTIDTLTGGQGDQYFRGNGGSDTINGGPGNDWALYDTSPAGVTINLTTGSASDGYNGLTGKLALGGTDTLISIENAEGSKYADTITGSDGKNWLIGGLGNDTLNGAGGFDTAVYRNAGGGVAVDLAAGTATGGDGSDTLASIEAVEGTEGFGDTLRGSAEANSLYGYGGNDVLEGRAGNDTLNGGPGADTLAGGADNDIYVADASDTITENVNEGIDTVRAGMSLNVATYPNVENLGLLGGGNFNATGDGGANVLSGNRGNNVLTGGLGNDTLLGGLGFDTGSFSGAKNAYMVSRTGAVVTVNGPEGVDTLTGLEKITFSDGSQTLPTIGRAAGTDLNADGKGDLIWRHESGQVVAWLVDGITVPGGADLGLTAPMEWRVVAVKDLSGDSKADLVWRHDNGTVAVWLLNGTSVSGGAGLGPAVGTPEWLGTDWHIEALADLNADSKSDILWRHDNGTVQAWLLNGLAVTTQANLPYAATSDWALAGLADVNADNKADAIWRNDSGEVSVWLLDGTNVSAAGQVGAVRGPEWSIAAVADFNNDHKNDLLWRSDEGQIDVWLLNGIQQPVTGTLPYLAPPGWNLEVIDDLNGDGKADLFWRNDSGPIAIWLVDGTQVPGAGGFPYQAPLGWNVAAVTDFNGDHKNDILWRHDSGPVVAWFVDGVNFAGGGQLPYNAPTEWLAT